MASMSLNNHGTRPAGEMAPPITGPRRKPMPPMRVKTTASSAGWVTPSMVQPNRLGGSISIPENEPPDITWDGCRLGVGVFR